MSTGLDKVIDRMYDRDIRLDQELASGVGNKMRYKKTKSHPSPEWCIQRMVVQDCLKHTRTECQSCQWSEDKVEIKVGDYIKSDFFSPMQGTVVSMGTLGKGIPAYKIRLPDGRMEFIIKGQAVLLWAVGEFEQGLQRYSRHD